MNASGVTFRAARKADVPRLVQLLADDPLGATREEFTDPLPASYLEAFEAIDTDPQQLLLVVCEGESIVGLLQLTYVPSLTYRGSWRAQIEGVRVAKEARSSGLGRRLIEESIARATARGCRLIQLTSDKQRPKAISFYEALGFAATHEGMKLHLPVDGDGSV